MRAGIDLASKLGGSATVRRITELFPFVSSVSNKAFLGLGLLWLWLNIVGEFALGHLPAGQVMPFNPIFVNLSVFAASALALLSAPLYAHRLRISNRGWVLAAASALMAVGSSLLIIASCFGGLAVAFLVMGGILAGIGYAILLLGWGEGFSSLQTEEIEESVPLCVLLEAFLMVVLLCLNGIVRIAAVILIPILCSILLQRACVRTRSSESDVVRVLEPTRRRIANSSFKRSVALLFFSYVAIGYAGASSQQQLLGTAYSGSALVVIGMVIAIVLAAVYILASIKINFLEVYRIASPILVLSLITAVFDSQYLAVASNILAVMANQLIMIFAFIYFVSAARKGWYSQARSLGLTQGACMAGLLLGLLCALLFQGSLRPVWLSPQALPVILIGVFIAARELLPLHGARAEVGIDDVDSVDRVDDGIIRACVLVAKEHGLSPRELQILGYLSRGRSRSYIQEALQLSHNTVSSYTKTLYRKLSVHSKQELQDMIEKAAGL